MISWESPCHQWPCGHLWQCSSHPPAANAIAAKNMSKKQLRVKGRTCSLWCSITFGTVGTCFQPDFIFQQATNKSPHSRAHLRPRWKINESTKKMWQTQRHQPSHSPFGQGCIRHHSSHRGIAPHNCSTTAASVSTSYIAVDLSFRRLTTCRILAVTWPVGVTVFLNQVGPLQTLSQTSPGCVDNKT